MIRSLTAGLRLLVVFSLALLSMLGTAVPAAAAQPPAIRQDEPVDSLDGVESAVVQIEAVGTFVDPEEGRQQNMPGFGSGFIIDSSGIAVTNNHVVTGGALFKVLVAGRDKPVNARVLGASECYDLAVIDLQGDGYPYLQWYEEPVRVGLDVYAAGFPLGDPEFTLTRGIIAKSNADGESSWASLDNVFMHDATINPGNSGGPLVATDGRVVGVNYASDDEVNQYFAIRASDAQAIIEQLIGGDDVESLGINGEAIETDSGVSAVYVYSVKSGSPADRVGILPGDYVLEIEGLAVGANGIMTDYCDILASHSQADVMSVQIFRPDTEEVLEGQFNGRPLETSFSIADQVDENDDGSQLAPATDEYTYVPISGQNNIVHIEAPDVWTDIADDDWEIDDEVVGTKLTVAPDLEGFYEDWGVPGVVFSYSDNLQDEFTPEELLATLDYSDQCADVERYEMPDDSAFVGAYDEYSECGGGDTTALVAALVSAEGDYMLGIEVYATTDADLEALDHILDTFYIGKGGAPGAVTDVGADIFDLVDVSGLEYDYTFVNEPYFSGLLPAAWTDINSRVWEDDEGEYLGQITEAAPDIDEYRNSWAAPGMQAFLLTDVGPDYDVEESMDAVDFSDICTYEERVPDIVHSIYGVTYRGAYDVYTRCDDSDTIYYTGVYLADSSDHAYIIDLISATAADDEAFEVLLNSFFLGAAVQPELNADEYTLVVDESGRISLQVPAAWTDSLSLPFEIDDEVVGVELTVSTDVAEFNDNWETAGANIAVWDDFGEPDSDEVLDAITFDDQCTYDTRYEYEADNFSGKYDLWGDCGGVEGASLATFALSFDSLPDSLVVLYIGTPTTDDLSILDPILNSLRVAPAE
jgi:serine protease Do